MSSEAIEYLIEMPECSHCGRPIPTDEAKKLHRERGSSPLLCQSCVASEIEINDLSADDI